MFVDASALTAVMLNEPDAQKLARVMALSSSSVTSSLAVWETVVAVSRETKQPPSIVFAAVSEVLIKLEVRIVPVPPEAARLAIEAFERFGKGRHPAALNFGDCFSYACARHLDMPLLFKGDDFDRTDIPSALAVD